MSWPYLILGLVAFQRVAEAIYGENNRRRLVARGGTEAGGGHYPLMILLHGGWLVALALSVPAQAPVNPVWLSLFLVLQAARFWVLASLGPFWTTRVVTVPGEPLVRRGPYRFLRHPNYLVVCIEIPVLPMVFGLWQLAIAFGAANLALLAWRIRLEDRILAPRRQG